ncbi:SIR2 family protein [Psychrobacter sp. R86515]|uniref:SIR2 family protein n=1 Tax=Psychrobacter sp. R86515 TaxID=3093855 RepID=UPI0036D3643E
MNNNENPYAVEDLAKFMRLAKKAEKPFIFITGAGCSVTAGIPLAQKIVSELNEKFALELKPLSDEDRRDYGKCMGRLEASKRREYLQKYIGTAKINWSHIALACLIKEGYIRRVLTFNFDNLLARSCGLLGQYPPTYDFTAANLNLHRLIDDPAIVHLHGQGHGFVQLNTDSETEEHAARLKEFVGHTLSESPTLFIGYSGKNDAFLPQIEEQFDDQHRLFWVDMGGQAPDHLQRKLLSSRLAHYMSCENGSDLFLIQLARELGCFPPTIFADPYQHLLDELDEIASFPISKNELSAHEENGAARFSDSTQDILLETKNKLKEVQRDRNGENDFLQEYLQGNYQKIVRILEVKDSLNHDQSLWLARSYLSLALEEPNELEKIRIYDKLINKFREGNILDIQEQVAKALVNKAVMLEKIGNLDDAVDVCGELLNKFSASSDLVIQVQVARALNGMGYSKLLKAKQQWSMPDEAKFYLNAALEDLTIALRLLPENLHAIILGNIAYIKFLQEKITQSETYLRKALHYGGRHLYEATLQDIVRFPINPDSEFKELLEIIWKEINE